MRVIAGSARRTPLKTLEGLSTRPTQDRIKETLFNMLQQELADCWFLDLFAGSGGIGIEALSRGAAGAVFVDLNPAAVKIVRENLAATHLADRAAVMNCDAIAALHRLEGQRRFDFIFLDPPYGHGLERRVLEALAESPLIDKQSTVIIEAGRETEFDYLEELGYVVERQKIYKTNQHVFVYRKDPEEKSSDL